MKKLMLLVLLAVGTMSLTANAAPAARIVDTAVSVAAGSTNGVKDAWIILGEDTKVIAPAGKVNTGVGVVVSIIYSVSGNLTNGTLVVSAYDAGVKSTLYTATGVTSGGSGRFNLTNTVYSGRLYLQAYQTTSTNVASAWAVSAIVE